ncbi:aminoglycoside phosphotransferase family protein [Jeongeupia chitinilytica]|uniref:3'-kinase n=1 Tax=Jeongeupia chitinilytica TaxID=1041641 RepID=A0ABQ3H1V8_9NEIS|nr:aminoglycoside phosphotransferase family protein [Jeongeupia chitinilytica]GHD63659.1 3'-kinase [Jeongeupia chitinilytica]
MNDIEDAEGMADVQACLTRWQLTARGAPWRTGSSWLQAVRFNGEPAILKVARIEEEHRGGQLMVWWRAHGAVRVLAHDGDAILLEQADDRRSLADMARLGDDDAASRIICDVAARLHAPQSHPRPALLPLPAWFSSLHRVAGTQAGVLGDAASVAADLLASPQDITVLHGDLHHGNVLDAGERGWLAIDPKVLIGERGFDFANILCNPDHELATSPGRLERQVAVIAEAAALERGRLLAWVAAWSGLSAAWHLEDGTEPHTALAVAGLALDAMRAG